MKEKFWVRAIVLFSIAVPLLVTLLIKVSPPVDAAANFNWKLLPRFHAMLNGSVFFLLLSSWYFIKNKNIKAHRICNILALCCSAVFLCSYVVYHAMTEPTRYLGTGLIRYFYFFILNTHVILAAVILPIILFTFLRAFNGQVERHRKLARWTMPLWLYVSATGVIVYLMLKPYY